MRFERIYRNFLNEKTQSLYIEPNEAPSSEIETIAEGVEKLSIENGQLQMQLKQMQEQANQMSIPQHMTGMGNKDMMIRQLQMENKRLQQSIYQLHFIRQCGILK